MHDHGGPTPERALWVALSLNAAFLVLEAGVGFWTNSLALLSDAGHMVSDVVALAVALIALRVANRRPSPSYTFGLRRAPVLGALINGVSLLIIVVLIGVEAVERFIDPPTLDAMPVFWTGVAGLAVNLCSAWYLARSRDESVNTRGAIVHLLADALGSVAAIVAAVAAGIFGIQLADPVASVVIGVLILLGSWPLIRDTTRILLQRAPANLDVKAAKRLLNEHPRVRAVLDFHVWGLDEGQTILSAVLVVEPPGLLDANRVADELREALRIETGVKHATLECRARAANPTSPAC
ncbi:MAG: cobalt-zinc-cadmium efflux system protein [Myxococcota bacterium]